MKVVLPYAMIMLLSCGLSVHLCILPLVDHGSLLGLPRSNAACFVLISCSASMYRHAMLQSHCIPFLSVVCKSNASPGTSVISHAMDVTLGGEYISCMCASHCLLCS